MNCHSRKIEIIQIGNQQSSQEKKIVGFVGSSYVILKKFSITHKNEYSFVRRKLKGDLICTAKVLKKDHDDFIRTNNK